MKRIFIFFFIIVSFIFSADYIWIEGESPAKSNFQLSVWSGNREKILSDGKWATYTLNKEEISSKLPADGFLLSYDFDVEKEGEYEVWVRIGYE
jgi:hypothetical protein